MTGPIFLDLLEKKLFPVEAELLKHPLVGGVILFTRNYESPEQLEELIKSIRKACKKLLLISVDHEGGRVQRFRNGFTHLPSMGVLGKFYLENREKALALTKSCGLIMAWELLALGVDFSFAPVLDLNKGLSTVIGDRAFHRDPAIVTTLALALMSGMNEAGMASVGKHFPGHGSVQADSHVALPIDNRPLVEIFQSDLIPFQQLSENISAIMPAHIIFSQIDNRPVGFSPIWLQDILRKQLKFTGVIISDDLSMEGAAGMGSVSDRAQQALEAGCDMTLICNNREGVVETLDTLPQKYFLSEEKFKKLQGTFHYQHHSLRNSSQWKQLSEQLKGPL